MSDPSSLSTPNAHPSQPNSGVRLAVLLAVAYFIADFTLNKLALGDGWQIFWPLNGVTIALLINRSPGQWAGLLLAITIGTAAGEYLDDNSLGSTLVQRALSLIEVLVSAAVLPRFTTLGNWLRQRGLYARFTLAVIAGPVISGGLAAAYFYWAQSASVIASFNSWALSDAMGIAAVLPLTLAALSPETRALGGSRQWLRFAAVILAAVMVMSMIFVTSRYPLIFVLYPLLMLVDWLLGLLGSSIALLIACVLAVYLTEHGYGPFADSAQIDVPKNLAVQLYLAFHLIGFLPISILFLEQRRMDAELRAALARTAALASLDALTGVANRRTLDERLSEEWRKGMREQTPVSLLMIDADFFKEFNDHFGHQAGDDCLRAIAATLSRNVSRPGDLVSRFGGEEFAILLPATPLEGARILGETLRAAIAGLEIARPPTIHTPHSNPASVGSFVTVSIGCAALIPEDASDSKRLVEDSDQALYRAKREGRDRVCCAPRQAEVWRRGSAAKKLRDRIEAFRNWRGRPGG